MLWPLILPVQLTAALMGVVLIATLYVGTKRKWSHVRTALLAVIATLLLFVPSCVVVSQVVDAVRFGMFIYPDFGSINDFRVERYMPPAASEIHVYKHDDGNGYRARFSIEKRDLQQWHNDQWQKHGEHSVAVRPEDDMSAPIHHGTFERCFKQFNWSQPADLVSHHSPVAGNGAHYTIWYSDSQQLAFLTSCYW